MGQGHTCYDACSRGYVDAFDGNAEPRDQSPPADQLSMRSFPFQQPDTESNGSEQRELRERMAPEKFSQPLMPRVAEAATIGPETTSSSRGGSRSVIPDDDTFAQLVQMGFPENGAKRACMAVNNSSLDAAMEWALAHVEDRDFNDPVPVPSAELRRRTAIDGLMNLGFSRDQAAKALDKAKGNAQVAADMLLQGSS